MKRIILLFISICFGYGSIAYTQAFENSFREAIIQSSKETVEVSRQLVPELFTELEEVLLDQLHSDLSEIENELQQASEKHRDVIHKHLPVFLGSLIRSEVQGDSELSSLSMRIISRQAMLGIRGALRTTPPIPEGEERILILDQNELLLNKAMQTMKRIHPNHNPDQLNEVFDMVLSRIPRYMDNPFSPRCKRPLNQQEMNQLVEKWENLDFTPTGPTPRAEWPASMVHSMQRANLMQTATMIMREWARLYRDEEIMTDLTLEELLDEKTDALRER